MGVHTCASVCMWQGGGAPDTRACMAATRRPPADVHAQRTTARSRGKGARTVRSHAVLNPADPAGSALPMSDRSTGACCCRKPVTPILAARTPSAHTAARHARHAPEAVRGPSRSARAVHPRAHTMHRRCDARGSCTPRLRPAVALAEQSADEHLHPEGVRYVTSKHGVRLVSGRPYSGWRHCVRERWGRGRGMGGMGCLRALGCGESADTARASHTLWPADAKQPLLRAVGMFAPVRTATRWAAQGGEPAGRGESPQGPTRSVGRADRVTCRPGPWKNVVYVHSILDHGDWERAASDVQTVPFDRTRNVLEWSRHVGA